MGFLLHLFLLFLRIVNVILHSVGSYLLISLYKSGEHNNQHLYLINLSFSEAFGNLIGIFITPIGDFISLSDKNTNIIDEVQYYIWIIVDTLVEVLYFTSMIYITIDRLLDILLNIRYPIYWNEKKTKYLLFGTWVAGVLLCLVVSLLHALTGYDYDDAFSTYFYPTFDFTFLIISIITYAFIFNKYKKTRVPPSSIQGDIPRSQQPSAFKIFQRSRFFTMFLLITTFIIFVIIPDLIYLSIGIIADNNSDVLLSSCFVSYSISNIVDGWIYIFTKPNVRHLLKKKMHLNSNSISDTGPACRRSTETQETAVFENWLSKVVA